MTKGPLEPSASVSPSLPLEVSMTTHRRYGLLSFMTLAICTFVYQNAIAQTDTTLAVRPDTTQTNTPRVPVITVTADDLDSELGAQDISGILQSSRDVYTATAGFNFGTARYRVRGYDSRNMLVSINGVFVNDMESGWATWSQWAGLNDVTRYMEVRTGVAPSRYNFGGLGGYTDLNVRASNVRKGVRVSYASADRAYRNRLMVTASTGMRKDGWAFSFSGSRRWADEGYAEGTSFDAYAYFLSAEKKLNDRHSISFSGFGAPMVQGRQGVAVQEAYDLAGTNYYNPNWGYQDGVKRNARMSFDHKPMFIASHQYTPNEKTNWNTSIYYTFGRDGLSGLQWFDAQDPRPDYYRYLPSYYTPTSSTSPMARTSIPWRTPMASPATTSPGTAANTYWRRFVRTPPGSGSTRYMTRSWRTMCI